MTKYTRRERGIYRVGKAAGYAEGYRQGLEDGNPFIKIAKAAGKILDGLAKVVADPDFMAALEEARKEEETQTPNFYLMRFLRQD